jgi:hypothetical protein
MASTLTFALPDSSTAAAAKVEKKDAWDQDCQKSRESSVRRSSLQMG